MVITQWHSFANKTELIALQGAALQYFEQHATPARPWGWVGDVRRMGAIPEEAQRWLQEDFNPRAIAAGLRVVSVVVADSIFGKIATQRYAQQTLTQAATLGISYSLAGGSKSGRLPRAASPPDPTYYLAAHTGILDEARTTRTSYQRN